MVLFLAIILLGISITISMFSFRKMGGSFASSETRERMKSWGMDPLKEKE
ncbi:MAG: hypothetical protein IJI46_01455 [Erysipelotrichaceae bacterium]|nr:hypothetical protein [Erysipelotrichaceae bacterium]